MSKGDYAKIKVEIAGKLEVFDVIAGSGGNIEVEFPSSQKDRVIVRQLGRTGKAQRVYTFFLAVVRSIEEKHAGD